MKLENAICGMIDDLVKALHCLFICTAALTYYCTARRVCKQELLPHSSSGLNMYTDAVQLYILDHKRYVHAMDVALMQIDLLL